jgi:hypothetical protein
MTATLHAESHTPIVNKLWSYSVQATDASGHALSGTVDTQFVYGGQVVGRESPPTHPLTNGRLDDQVTFPSESIAIQLTFEVVVNTSLGSVTLDWPVRAQAIG